VGELAGAEVVVAREGENPSDPVVEDAPADAPFPAAGVAMAMQGEGTPAGHLVSFLLLFFFIYLTETLYVLLFCRYGG
jgi:hypothetical protein